jgi:hypothetical protein
MEKSTKGKGNQYHFHLPNLKKGNGDGAKVGHCTTTHYGVFCPIKETTIVLFNYNHNYLVTKIIM